MKKKVLLVLLPVFLIGAIIAIRNYQMFPRRAKAAMLLDYAGKLTAFMDETKKKQGQYPSPEEIDRFLQTTGFKWGTGKDVKDICPDCMIDPEGYRIVVYTNLDSDPKTEAIVIMNGEVPLKVSDDLTD